MIQMSLLLFEFVQWIESSYGHLQSGKLSDFAIEPPPETLVMAELAFEAGLNSEHPVVLSTDFPVRSIISSPVLTRAGVKLEDIFLGRLTDEQFESLAEILMKVKRSKLLIHGALLIPWSYDQGDVVDHG